MPPKRKSERALPARKTSEARAASREATSAANETKSAAPKKSKTSAIATPANRKRERSPNTGISCTKPPKAAVSLCSNPQQPPPSTQKLDDKAASDNGGSSSTRKRPATAHSPQPPLKATRTRSRVSATTKAAVPGSVTAAADTASTIKTTEGGESRITGAADGNYSEGLSLLYRYLPLPSSTSMNSSSLRVAPEWGTTGATVFSMFLAEAQAHLVRQCCRQLAQLTTSTTPAFLHAAALGEAALATSPPPCKPANANSCSGDQDLLTPVDPLVDRQEQTYRTLRATIAASCTLGHRSCQVLWGPRGSGKHRILRLLAQDVRCTPNTFVMELQGRLLSSDEAALGVIAEQMLAFLRSPQSAQLRASHYLLRTGTFEFGQLFHFERRMQANGTPATANASQGATTRSMRNKDATLPQACRYSTLNSGRNAQGAGQRHPKSSTTRAPPPPATHSHGRKGPRETQRNSGRRASDLQAERDTGMWSGDVSEDASADEDDEQGSSVMVTSTTTYLTGGATSALPHLQRALLLLKGQGCSIVVCVRDIDVFGIRCDQLLYVLAGLMHDSDTSRGGGSARGRGAGGGLSLLLASAAPDIRQLEKRLSSRLTCETRYVPLLPWSLRNLLAATLQTIAQDALNQVRTREVTHLRVELVETLRSESLRRWRGTDVDGGSDRASNREKALMGKAMSDLQTQLHAMDAELRELRVQRRHLSSLFVTEATTSSNKAVCSTLGYSNASGWRSSLCPPLPAPQKQASASENSTVPSFTAVRTWSLNSLLAHPSLTLEVQCVMCEELLRQLRSPGCEDKTQGIAGADTLGGHDPSSLAQLVTRLTTELEVNSGSSSTALTVLASYLCKTSSGTVDFLGQSGRGVLFSWLRARLQHERIPAATINAALAAQASAAHPGSVPPIALSRWLEAAESAAMDAMRSSHAVCHRTPPELSPLSLLPPHIHDLLADGQLVGMGYGSREVLLVLFYMHIHHTNGMRQRTVADLLEDVSSSLGTKAAAALDREAFRLAIRHLCRWKLLRVVEVHSQLLEMCGSDARLRDFLLSLLSKKQNWCEAELGLDAREIMRFRNLL